jgi:hypothetical protein
MCVSAIKHRPREIRGKNKKVYIFRSASSKLKCMFALRYGENAYLFM